MCLCVSVMEKAREEEEKEEEVRLHHIAPHDSPLTHGTCTRGCYGDTVWRKNRGTNR